MGDDDQLIPKRLGARALQGLFTDYLPRLRGLSPHTLHSYRHTLVLLLRILASSNGIAPAPGSTSVISFLRMSSVFSVIWRAHATAKHPPAIVRLAAIHAFFQHVAAQFPDRIEQAQRILSVPLKRAETQPVY